MLSAVSHTVVRRPSGATAGLITVEFNYELSYITTESLIYIHPLAPLTRWHHAVCAQSAYRVHTAIVLSGNERSRCTLDLELANGLIKLLLPDPLSEKVGGHLLVRDMLRMVTSPERIRCLR